MTQRRRKIMKTLPYSSLLFVITLATIKVSVADEVRCPRYCLCYFDSRTNMRTVACVARRLASIDLSIPKRVQTLDLSNNSISVIEDRAFQNYELRELVNLVIKHNSVQTVGLHSFAGLSYLQWLDLTDNRLYQIHPWTFHDNSNLRIISLSDNPLGHITHSGPILDVPSLEILLLSKCNFAHFPEEAFSALPKLRILDLSHNQLIGLEVYSLEFLYNLEELDISSNPWQCNTNLENLKGFMDGQSSNLIGSSCDLPRELKEITTQKATFEKIISVGVVYPEYDDVSKSDEDVEDSAEETVSQTDRFNNCSSGRNTDRFYNEPFLLSPTLHSLVGFQFGVCASLFIGFFCKYCKRKKQMYRPLQSVITTPVQREFESTIVIPPVVDEQPVQVSTETLSCPETPPPSYRELYMPHYP